MIDNQLSAGAFKFFKFSFLDIIQGADLNLGDFLMFIFTKYPTGSDI